MNKKCLAAEDRLRSETPKTYRETLEQDAEEGRWLAEWEAADLAADPDLACENP